MGTAVTVRGFHLPGLLISSSDFVFPRVPLYLLVFVLYLCFTQGIKGGEGSFAMEANAPSSHWIAPYPTISPRGFSSGDRAR